MKNHDKWQPSKFVFKKGKLIASRDKREVSVGSRLMADITDRLYDENLRRYATGRLLDLGCGKVPLYGSYKQYVTDIICIDRKNTLHKNEYLDFECDITNGLPFQDNEFDTIVLSDVLEHMPQPENLWKEMCRVLSVYGKLIMNVPFYYGIHERPYDYYRYTEFALKRFADGAGLTVVKFEIIGGSPEILTDILAKHFNVIPLIGPPLAIFIQYIIALFVKTTFGKKVSSTTSGFFPLGYFLVAEKT